MANRKIGFIIDGDLFATLHMKDDNIPFIDGIVAGMLSNPEIIDLSDNDDVRAIFDLYVEEYGTDGIPPNVG